MKRIMVILAMIGAIGTANALPNMSGGAICPHNEYNEGYKAGKSHAYNNTAKGVFIVGVAIIAGMIIYQAGKDSRWGVNENGVTYRF